jgi:hypothetical protein
VTQSIKTLTVCGIAALALGVGACAPRKKLTQSHGEASRAFFRAQTVNPEAGDEAAVATSLESQEAKIIWSTYKSQLTQGSSSSSPDLLRDDSLIILPTEGDRRRGGQRQ